jgi:malic enzyme
MKKLAALVVVLVVFGGCSARNTSTDPTLVGNKVAWVGEKEAMLDDMHTVMAQTFPGRQIFKIDGKGVYTWQRSMIDKFTHQALLLPTKGTDKNDNVVDAYMLEVSGDGTIFSGPSRNKKLFEELVARFNEKYAVVTVK